MLTPRGRLPSKRKVSVGGQKKKEALMNSPGRSIYPNGIVRVSLSASFLFLFWLYLSVLSVSLPRSFALGTCLPVRLVYLTGWLLGNTRRDETR